MKNNDKILKFIFIFILNFFCYNENILATEYKGKCTYNVDVGTIPDSNDVNKLELNITTDDILEYRIGQKYNEESEQKYLTSDRDSSVSDGNYFSMDGSKYYYFDDSNDFINMFIENGNQCPEEIYVWVDENSDYRNFHFCLERNKYYGNYDLSLEGTINDAGGKVYDDNNNPIPNKKCGNNRATGCKQLFYDGDLPFYYELGFEGNLDKKYILVAYNEYYVGKKFYFTDDKIDPNISPTQYKFYDAEYGTAYFICNPDNIFPKNINKFDFISSDNIKYDFRSNSGNYELYISNKEDVCSFKKNDLPTESESPVSPKDPDIKDLSFCEEEGVLRTFKILGYLIFVLKLAIPLILIVLASVDFGKAALSGDDKANSEILKTLISRIAIGVIIFFIPTIINFFLRLLKDYSRVIYNFNDCRDCLFSPNGDKCKKLLEDATKEKDEKIGIPHSTPSDADSMSTPTPTPKPSVVGNVNYLKTTSSKSGNYIQKRLDNVLKEKGSSVEALNNVLMNTVIKNGVATRKGIAALAIELVGGLWENYQIKLPYTWGGYRFHDEYSDRNTGKRIEYVDDNYFGVNPAWGAPTTDCDGRTYKDDKYPVSLGPDCVGFIHWLLLNSGFNFYRGEFGSTNNFPKKALDGTQVGQVGDLLDNGTHVSMIVGVDTEKKLYYKAESKMTEVGICITTTPFDDDSGFSVLDMTDWYANNRRFTNNDEYKKAFIAGSQKFINAVSS